MDKLMTPFHSNKTLVKINNAFILKDRKLITIDKAKVARLMHRVLKKHVFFLNPNKLGFKKRSYCWFICCFFVIFCFLSF